MRAAGPRTQAGAKDVGPGQGGRRKCGPHALMKHASVHPRRDMKLLLARRQRKSACACLLSACAARAQEGVGGVKKNERGAKAPPSHSRQFVYYHIPIPTLPQTHLRNTVIPTASIGTKTRRGDRSLRNGSSRLSLEVAIDRGGRGVLGSPRGKRASPGRESSS